jgi:hypothetical protein
MFSKSKAIPEEIRAKLKKCQNVQEMLSCIMCFYETGEMSFPGDITKEAFIEGLDKAIKMINGQSKIRSKPLPNNF